MNNDLEDRVKEALNWVLPSVSNAPVDRDRVEHRRHVRNRRHIHFAMAVGSALVVVGLSVLALARSTDGVSTVGNPDTSADVPQPSDPVRPAASPQTTTTTGAVPATTTPAESHSIPDDYSITLLVGAETAAPEGTPFIRIWREYHTGVEFLMMDFTRASVPAGAVYWDVLIDGKLAFRSNAAPTPGTRGHRLAAEQSDREITVTVQSAASDLSILAESSGTVTP